jgi:MFS superfamily sulfate permease-like transporter
MSQSTYKQDFMASIVVFLVALPLCMGIAIASGVPVAAGLITGILGGIVVGAIAGCPLQVSGPAAGLTVIVIDIVQRYGLETLGIIVLLSGAIQILAGMLRLGPWFRAVSPAVIKGMLTGIGVLIFASQCHVMVDDKPKGNGIQNLVTIPQAIAKGLALPRVQTQEARKYRKQLLQDVGELHRQQVDLQERVGECFPHLHQPDKEFSESQKEAAQKRLDRYSELQEQLSKELLQISNEIQDGSDFFESGELEKAVAKTQAATQQNEIALTAFKKDEPRQLLDAQDAAVVSLQELLDQLKNHNLAAMLGFLAVGLMLCWHIVPAKLHAIPGPLIAVVVTTFAAALFSLPVLYVEIPDRLWDGIHFPSLTVLQDADFLLLLKSALFVAVVASAETLLCATAVDQMQDGKRTNYNRELIAQGVGNMLCGTLGALPMTGVIVRSSANIHGGGKTRLSAILHGFWLLIFVASLGFLLRQIPTACLAAILVYTGFKLINFKAIRELAIYGRSEVAIYLTTIAMIVSTDLLTGVLAGIALAAVKLLYTFSHLETKLTVDQEKHSAILSLYGAATFIRLPRVAAELESVPRGTELHVDFEHLDYIDHACLELMMNWAKQHENTGGRLVIDWESLHARFRTTGLRSGIPDANSPTAPTREVKNLAAGI